MNDFVGTRRAVSAQKL